MDLKIRISDFWDRENLDYGFYFYFYFMVFFLNFSLVAFICMGVVLINLLLMYDVGCLFDETYI